MRIIENLMILAALSVVLVAMSATGARAQLITYPEFVGSFTLPVQASWGSMTLPPGSYGLYYGMPFKGGLKVVEVVNKADGSARGVALIRGLSQASGSTNELICTREGDMDYVRALDLPVLGKSIQFGLPHNMKLVASQQDHSATKSVAKLHGLTERFLVTSNRG
jgi:hypothetical protein